MFQQLVRARHCHQSPLSFDDCLSARHALKYDEALNLLQWSYVISIFFMDIENI